MLKSMQQMNKEVRVHRAEVQHNMAQSRQNKAELNKVYNSQKSRIEKRFASLQRKSQ